MPDFATVPADVVSADETYLMHTYRPPARGLVSAKGAVLTDSTGKDYLDFLGGIGCASLGHCHPAVVAAVRDQAEKLWQVGQLLLHREPQQARRPSPACSPR